MSHFLRQVPPPSFLKGAEMIISWLLATVDSIQKSRACRQNQNLNQKLSDRMKMKVKGLRTVWQDLLFTISDVLYCQKKHTVCARALQKIDRIQPHFAQLHVTQFCLSYCIGLMPKLFFICMPRCAGLLHHENQSRRLPWFPWK